jgi:hypothetical protein
MYLGTAPQLRRITVSVARKARQSDADRSGGRCLPIIIILYYITLYIYIYIIL